MTSLINKQVLRFIFIVVYYYIYPRTFIINFARLISAVSSSSSSSTSSTTGAAIDACANNFSASKSSSLPATLA